MASEITFRLKKLVPDTLLPEAEKAAEKVDALLLKGIEDANAAADAGTESGAALATFVSTLKANLETLKKDPEARLKLLDIAAGDYDAGEASLPGGEDAVAAALRPVIDELGGMEAFFAELIDLAKADGKRDAYEKGFFTVYAEDLSEENQEELEELDELPAPSVPPVDPTVDSTSKLFSSDTPLIFEIKAPFANMFARANNVDEPIPEEVKVRVMSLDGKKVELTGTIKTRGETSPEDVEFDKLTVKLDGAKNTPFAGSKKFKIGTHLGESDSLTEMGRLASEWVPRREVFVYDLLEHLGLATLETRPASALYIDAKTSDSASHSAFLLEDYDKAAERLGGVAIDDWDLKGQLNGKTSDEEKMRLSLLNVLFGNWDYSFPDESVTLSGTGANNRHVGHNIWAVQRPDGSVVLLPNDFDLATIVSGGPLRYKHNEAAFVGKGPRFGEMVRLMDELKDRFDWDDLSKMIDEIAAKMPGIRAFLEAYPMSETSKANVRQHLDVFVEAARAALTMPVQGPDFVAYSDVGGTQEVDVPYSGSMQVLESSGEMRRVRFAAEIRDGQVGEAWVKASDLRYGPEPEEEEDD
jgi:hypothetical protein